MKGTGPVAIATGPVSCPMYRPLARSAVVLLPALAVGAPAADLLCVGVAAHVDLAAAGLLALGDAHGEHAVFERGLDVLGVYVAREDERAGEGAPAALGQMVAPLLPLGALLALLAADGEHVVLHVDLDVVALEAGHLHLHADLALGLHHVGLGG